MMNIKFPKVEEKKQLLTVLSIFSNFATLFLITKHLAVCFVKPFPQLSCRVILIGPQTTWSQDRFNPIIIVFISTLLYT